MELKYDIVQKKTLPFKVYAHLDKLFEKFPPASWHTEQASPVIEKLLCRICLDVRDLMSDLIKER